MVWYIVQEENLVEDKLKKEDRTIAFLAIIVTILIGLAVLSIIKIVTDSLRKTEVIACEFDKVEVVEREYYDCLSITTSEYWEEVDSADDEFVLLKTVKDVAPAHDYNKPYWPATLSINRQLAMDDFDINAEIKSFVSIDGINEFDYTLKNISSDEWRLEFQNTGLTQNEEFVELYNEILIKYYDGYLYTIKYNTKLSNTAQIRDELNYVWSSIRFR